MSRRMYYENHQSSRLSGYEQKGSKSYLCPGYYEAGLRIRLATGSTPIGAYQQLVEWCENGDLDFSAVKSVNLDEYKGLPRTNDQSYYYLCTKICLTR